MHTRDVSERARELSEFAQRFWAGEAEVARAFFSQPRTVEQQARWLRHQCYRELRGPGFLPRPKSRVQWLFEQVKQGLPFAESPEGRVELEHQLEALRQEFTHFRLLADILDDLTGEPVRMQDLQHSTLPEDRELEELRQGYLADDARLARVAFDFAEGGGAGIFYAGRDVGGDALAERIAQACRVIYNDEVGHGQHGAQEVEQEIRTEAEWDRVHEMVIAICRQRLRVRNAQFGNPLSEERLEQIAEGQIEPLVLGA